MWDQLKDGDTIKHPKRSEKELTRNSEPEDENESFDSLEHDFTYEESKGAASSLSVNKTPGEDGFTKEFYESFYDLIWRDLLISYDAAFQNGFL